MSDKKIKAVLFDLGDTLLNFGEVDIRAVFKEGAKSTYSFLKETGQPVGSLRRYSLRNFLAIRWRTFISDITGNDFDSLDLLKKIGKKQGYNLEEAQWQKLAELWYEPLKKFGHPEKDVRETLSKLKKMNLKLGIVSNTFVSTFSLDKHMLQAGLDGFFDFVLYSYQVPWRKPDKKIFRYAAEKIGEKCENIMFVGDRIDKDIAPALKMNMTAALKEAYTNTGKTCPEGVHRIKKIAELPAIIREINC
ncbi:MAG TPA: HAD family hydrolase [Sedimentisphaerales bacterium]|nr:HAD family hydrolase [Sedimentisphaerales bacterium]